jgi:hypothetical protein
MVTTNPQVTALPAFPQVSGPFWVGAPETPHTSTFSPPAPPGAVTEGDHGAD